MVLSMVPFTSPAWASITLSVALQARIKEKEHNYQAVRNRIFGAGAPTAAPASASPATASPITVEADSSTLPVSAVAAVSQCEDSAGSDQPKQESKAVSQKESRAGHQKAEAKAAGTAGARLGIDVGVAKAPSAAAAGGGPAKSTDKSTKKNDHQRAAGVCSHLHPKEHSTSYSKLSQHRGALPAPRVCAGSEE